MDLQAAAVFLDLSRDKTFSKEQREVFYKMAMERGARQLDVIPREKPRRRRRERAYSRRGRSKR